MKTQRLSDAFYDELAEIVSEALKRGESQEATEDQPADEPEKAA